MRDAFPIPNYKPRVCRWGCSAAPVAEGEQPRRGATGSGGSGGAEAAEVRAGELSGPPRRSGNGRAARRAGRGRPVARRGAPRGDPGPPRPSAPGLQRAQGRGAGEAEAAARAGKLLAAPSSARAEGVLCRAPGFLVAGGRPAGPELGNVSGPCCWPSFPTRSPARPRLGLGPQTRGAPSGAGLGCRHLCGGSCGGAWMESWPGGGVAVTDTSGVCPERG